MDESVFRQKSVERMTAPEQLNDHLKVITPRVWLLIGVIAALIACLFIWAGFTAVESYAEGKATVNNGRMTLVFDDSRNAQHVEEGMDIVIGSTETEIDMVGINENEQYFAYADTDLPDGVYDARVGYDTFKVISMLFN